MSNLGKVSIAARVAFYLGVGTLAISALSVQIPDWRAVGVTPLGFLQGADTWFLMSIAILLAEISGSLKEKK